MTLTTTATITATKPPTTTPPPPTWPPEWEITFPCDWSRGRIVQWLIDQLGLHDAGDIIKQLDVIKETYCKDYVGKDTGTSSQSLSSARKSMVFSVADPALAEQLDDLSKRIASGNVTDDGISLGAAASPDVDGSEAKKSKGLLLAAALGGLALLLCCCCFCFATWWRRRQKKKREANGENHPSAAKPSVATMGWLGYTKHQVSEFFSPSKSNQRFDLFTEDVDVTLITRQDAYNDDPLMKKPAVTDRSAVEMPDMDPLPVSKPLFAEDQKSPAMETVPPPPRRHTHQWRSAVAAKTTDDDLNLLPSTVPGPGKDAAVVSATAREAAAKPVAAPARPQVRRAVPNPADL